MTTAFVAGATGYTGREVVRQLAARGVRAIAHVRPDSSALEEWKQRFARMGAAVDTTSWQPSAMHESLRLHAPDVVFALLGTTRHRARAAAQAGAAPADYETVDYGMTHMLLEAMRAVAPGARFVYLSSLGARADTGNEYLRVRGRIEAELAASGISYVIGRPAIISGTDRGEKRTLERVFAIGGDAVLRTLALAGAKSMHARFRSISGERLASALIEAAFDPAVRDPVLDAGELHRRADIAAR